MPVLDLSVYFWVWQVAAIHSAICRWNTSETEVNTFQGKKKTVVSKQALTTEVFQFLKTQEFANMTPIKVNQKRTYESVCLEKKIFFASAFLGVV